MQQFLLNCVHGFCHSVFCWSYNRNRDFWNERETLVQKEGRLSRKIDADQEIRKLWMRVLDFCARVVSVYGLLSSALLKSLDCIRLSPCRATRYSLALFCSAVHCSCNHSSVSVWCYQILFGLCPSQQCAAAIMCLFASVSVWCYQILLVFVLLSCSLLQSFA